jgi:hypothetical protein
MFDRQPQSRADDLFKQTICSGYLNAISRYRQWPQTIKRMYVTACGLKHDALDWTIPTHTMHAHQLDNDIEQFGAVHLPEPHTLFCKLERCL